MAAMTCTSCRAVVAADDVDLSTRLGKCRSCGSVFEIADQVVRAGARDAAPLAIPAGYEVQGLDDKIPASPLGYRDAQISEPPKLVIRFRWFRWVAVFLIFFCIAWDAFLVNWYGMAAIMGDPPLIMLVFPIVHVAVGVGLTYYTLALLFNRTRIAIEAGRLRVRHGPLPWPGVDVDASEVSAVEVFEEPRKSNRRGRDTFRVMAHVGGRAVDLLRRVEDPHAARFIAAAISKTLSLR